MSKQTMPPAPSAPFVIVAPAGGPVPLVLSSPHSGHYYPEAMLAGARLSHGELRALGDGPVDELVARACADGATLLAAIYPRAVVDLNREACELDPEVLLDPDAVPGLRLTVKARAGLGVVPTRLLGEPIYRQRLSAAELQQRLTLAYEPYHAQLRTLARERRQRFGAVLVLDCHSMPTLPPLPPRGERAIDVALGDRFGRSCHARLVETAERVLGGAGLKVARNRPYAGGHITEHYGRPDQGSHALQIELRRCLFMDEATHERHEGFAALQELVGELARALAAAVLDLAREVGPRSLPTTARFRPLAAE
jgi:N-formylglutamate amidohydrolase